MAIDHDVPGGGPSVPPPLQPPATPDVRNSPAEEARTLLEATNFGTLATLTDEGDPWASFVAYGVDPDTGAPVLCVSTLAEHGRNLAHDPRASLAVTGRQDADPLATPRATLSGRVTAPSGDELERARRVHEDGVPSARFYLGMRDFTTYVLHVERVRWVGGYGRMASATGEQLAAAQADPVAPIASGAVAHLNEDHADALLAMARALGGQTDAEQAVCTGADRYGLDLTATGPRGSAPVRVTYAEPLTDGGQLRGATVELTRRARQA